MIPSVELRTMLESEPSPRFENIPYKRRDNIKCTDILKGI